MVCKCIHTYSVTQTKYLNIRLYGNLRIYTISNLVPFNFVEDFLRKKE